MKKYILLYLFTVGSLTSFAQTIDVVVGLNMPSHLLLDGNTLYFTDASNLSKLDISVNNPVVEVVASGLSDPKGMALKDDVMFIAEFGAGKIVKLDLTDPVPIAETVVEGLATPSGLALSGDFLYFSDRNSDIISKLNITDPAPTVIHVISGIGGPSDIAISGNYLYYSEFSFKKNFQNNITANLAVAIPFTNPLMNPTGIDVFGNKLFVAELDASRALSFDFAIATQTVIVSDLILPVEVAANATTLFIIEFGVNKIVKYEMLAGVEENLLETTVLFPNPSHETIQLSNLKMPCQYSIHSVLGNKVAAGTVAQMRISILGNSKMELIF